MSFQCPKCHRVLQKENRSYVCDKNHTYDIAKGGYVNLTLTNRKDTGDDKGMVDARTNFLQQGYYQPLQKTICQILHELQLHDLVDAGCGQGYYTNACRDVIDGEIYGFDLSKFALKEACKAHQDIHYAVASVADVPLSDALVNGWLSVFAPIYIEEIKRIVKKDGMFIKVGPGTMHLYELKQVLYDKVYENESEIVEYKGLTFIKRVVVEDTILLDKQADIYALFQMTPYYYRSSKEGVAKLQALSQLTTRIHFTIDLYKLA